MAGNVFLLDGDESLCEMNQTSYVSESELQNLVSKYPKILTNIIEDETGEEEKWMLIKQEMRVLDGENLSQRWPVDHLFISNKGVPVLVEVKRSTDPRVRREVVGQMLDYASNGVAYWSIEHICQSLKERCEEQGNNFNEEFESFLPNINQDDFWEKVHNNLKTGKIKMIFVADIIPKELKRIIEFLNQQMRPAEVLGVEIVKYEPTGFGKVKTLVSKVIGLSAQAEKRKFVGIVEEKVPQEGLQEAADEFNKLYSKESNYIAKGTAISYRQIRIPKIDSRLHYEFMHTNKNGLCIEFHIEADGYGKLATLLKEWAESKKTLNGLDILFDPKWSRGRGRVYIMAGSESTPEANANTMKALIEQTEPIIKSTIGVN